MNVSRVILISHKAPPIGGIATWTGFVLSAADVDPEIKIELINTAITWRSLVSAGLLSRALGGTLQGIWTLASLVRAILAKRTTSVHLCTAGEFGLARDLLLIATARAFRIPVVTHFHRSFPNLLRQVGPMQMLVRAVAAASSKIVVLNEPDRISFEKVAAGKVLLLPNMIDEQRIQTIPAAVRAGHSSAIVRIVFAGYVTPTKGVLDLVKAARRLHESGRELELIMVGPVEEEMQKALGEAANSPNPNWLHFTGTCNPDEVIGYMKSADIFCLPSHAEGLPYVILESMACAKAIVATNVGGIPAALSGCGICVNPRDVDSLTAALGQVCDDEELRARLGNEAAKRCADHFSTAAVYPKLVRLWTT